MTAAIAPGVCHVRGMPQFTFSEAEFDPSQRFRYLLRRRWSDEASSHNEITFCMLNPSTADAIKLDPTVRRCIGYAHRWGYDGIRIVNLFALRATDPRMLRATDDPVGPGNDLWIRGAARTTRVVVCAWGNHGSYLDRAREVRRSLSSTGARVLHLGLTRSGQPRHPLYLRGTVLAEGWV